MLPSASTLDRSAIWRAMFGWFAMLLMVCSSAPKRRLKPICSSSLRACFGNASTEYSLKASKIDVNVTSSSGRARSTPVMRAPNFRWTRSMEIVMTALRGWPRSYGAGVTKGRRRPGVELRAQRTTQARHVVGMSREPRAHPLRSLEERERRRADTPDGAAAHEPARVDEADVVEQAAGRDEACGDRTHARDRGERRADGAETEDVRAASHGIRQRAEHGTQRQTRKDRV